MTYVADNVSDFPSGEACNEVVQSATKPEINVCCSCFFGQATA